MSVLGKDEMINSVFPPEKFKIIRKIAFLLLAGFGFLFPETGNATGPAETRYEISVATHASQFDLWSEDYQTATYNLQLGLRSRNHWQITFAYTLAQNVRFYWDSCSWGEMHYRRYFSNDHFFRLTAGKDWRYLGLHLGLIGYALGADYWGHGTDNVPIPFPTLELKAGILASIYLSASLFGHLDFGKYYFDTSPVALCLNYQVNKMSGLSIGMVGFTSEAGLTLGANLFFSEKSTVEIRSVYHFREKIFGIGPRLRFFFN